MPEHIENVLNWIDRYTHNQHNLSSSNLDFIRDYTLLWHLLEKEHFGRFFKVGEVAMFINKNIDEDFELTKYQSCIDYFKNRYLTNGVTNYRFGKLRIVNEDRERLVADVLKGDIASPQEVIEVMVYIVSRYRNNLFHGEKNIIRIADQKRNFEIANEFLMKLMDDLK
jgi:hypothetical protein